MAGNLVSNLFRNVNNTQTVINTKLSNNINEQHNAVKWEAQLVQRDRGTPRVIWKFVELRSFCYDKYSVLQTEDGCSVSVRRQPSLVNAPIKFYNILVL